VDNKFGLLASWQRSLQARNLAPKTIKTYLEAAGQLVDYVSAAGVESMAEIGRHHVEDLIAEQVETRSAATASVAKMRPPVVPSARFRYSARRRHGRC
jgi:site-specific recombinase XerD